MKSAVHAKLNERGFVFLGHNICNITTPASLLLSATGTLAFKNCAMTDEVCAFTAPEMLQGRAISTKLAMEKVSFVQRHPGGFRQANIFFCLGAYCKSFSMFCKNINYIYKKKRGSCGWQNFNVRLAKTF